jgi:multiple sugar transport system permease protein
VRTQEKDASSFTQDPKRNLRAKWKSFGQASFGYILLAPALIIILGLNLYPTISGVLTAFTNQSLLDPFNWAFVGFANFQKLFGDPVFRISLVHSLVLTGLAVSLQVVLGLILAHLLIEQVPGIQFFRSIGMIAWVLPIIASVVMFRFITLPNYGFINILLNDLGVGHLARNWFGDEKYAFVLILIMHLWRNVPFYAISFMAAMQAIPSDLYEAARIDGASKLALHHFGDGGPSRHFHLQQLRFRLSIDGGWSGELHRSSAYLHL